MLDQSFIIFGFFGKVIFCTQAHQRCPELMGSIGNKLLHIVNLTLKRISVLTKGTCKLSDLIMCWEMIVVSHHLKISQFLLSDLVMQGM